jgi:hypothetical protein
MRKILTSLFALIFILSPLASEARSPATGLPKFNSYSPREFVLGGSQHYNVVKNLMQGDASQLSVTNLPNTTGCVVTDSGSSTVLSATSSGTGRCYLFQTISNVAPLDPNKYYVAGGEFSNVVGTFTGINIAFSGSVAEGGTSLIKSANGRYAIGFRPIAGGSLALRIGWGTNSDETLVAGDTITVSNTFLYEIPNLQTAPNEYVWKGAVLPYGNTNATSSGNVTNGATTTQYTSTSKRGDSVLIIGDSFCNDSTDYAERLRYIANRSVYYDCVSGADLADEYTQFANWLANPPIEKSYYQRPKTVIFGGVINNIQGDDTLATIQSQTLDLASLAKANGMIPVFLGATPFGQASSWTQPRQDVLDAHRAWMVASSTQFLFVDPYDAFLSPTSTVNLVQGGSFGVSGDSLHPVGSGFTFYAQLIENMALKMIDRLSN